MALSDAAGGLSARQALHFAAGFTWPISALPRRGLVLCASGFHCRFLLAFRPSHSFSTRHPISASDTLAKASVICFPHYGPVCISVSPSRHIPGRPHLFILLARVSPCVYRVIIVSLSLGEHFVPLNVHIPPSFIPGLSSPTSQCPYAECSQLNYLKVGESQISVSAPRDFSGNFHIAKV